MKKVVLSLAAVTMLTVVSCKNANAEAEATEENPLQTEEVTQEPEEVTQEPEVENSEEAEELTEESAE